MGLGLLLVILVALITLARRGKVAKAPATHRPLSASPSASMRKTTSASESPPTSPSPRSGDRAAGPGGIHAAAIGSEKRLFLTARGDIGHTLQTPYREGTTHVIFEPLDFIARLAALVLPPSLNFTRFHGVFAPNSQRRFESMAVFGVAERSH